MAAFPPTDARAVANYFLAKASAEGMPLDPMKLMKLVYIAHGWKLGLTGEPLFADQVYAWPYGPVIPNVYHAFKHCGDGAIKVPAGRFDGLVWRTFEPSFDPYTEDLMGKVWKSYKDFTGPQLSTLTHKPGTPWAKVTANIPPAQIRDIPIPDTVIRDHYRELALRNQKARG